MSPVGARGGGAGGGRARSAVRAAVCADRERRASAEEVFRVPLVKAGVVVVVVLPPMDRRLRLRFVSFP